MINREQAEHIALQFIGASADDAENGWNLEEFAAGWLIMENATMNLRGAGTHVVERASGRVMLFPSYIAPDRILAEYDGVSDAGRPARPRYPA